MKEIFIFGAGASAASADTPLGPDLVWRYYQDCRRALPLINGVPDNSEEKIEFSNYEQFLELAERIFLELREKLLPEWKRRGMYGFTFPILNKKYYVDEMLQIVQENSDVESTNLLKKLIFEHIIGLAVVRQRNELYQEFVSKILKAKSSEEISVISFNFDFLLHEDFKKNVYFDYLINFDWIDENRKRIYKKCDGIPMIKLNGSFDWGICAKGNCLHLYYPHMRRDFYNQKKCGMETCDGIVEPFIIAPHQRYGDIINGLWKRARDELLQVEKVIVVGYSFPEYDKRTIELFRKSLRNDIELEIVDYSEPQNRSKTIQQQICNKYRSLFPHLTKEPRICLDGFEGYIKTVKNIRRDDGKDSPQ